MSEIKYQLANADDRTESYRELYVTLIEAVRRDKRRVMDQMVHDYDLQEEKKKQNIKDFCNSLGKDQLKKLII